MTVAPPTAPAVSQPAAARATAPPAVPTRIVVGEHALLVEGSRRVRGQQPAPPIWRLALSRTIVWYGRGAGGAELSIHPPGLARPHHRSQRWILYLEPAIAGLHVKARARPESRDRRVLELARCLLDEEGDIDGDAAALLDRLRAVEIIPPRSTLHSDLIAALSRLESHASLDALARGLAVKPERLRRLVRKELGVSLAHLRLWRRLRCAIEHLPSVPIADAAFEAGFADQPHLTRTATRFLGWTPSELKRALSGP